MGFATRVFRRLSELLDVTTYDLPANNGPLGSALSGKISTSNTSTGGNNAADSGKALVFGASGDITVSFGVSINDGSGNVATLGNSAGGTSFSYLPTSGGILLSASNNLSDLDNVSTTLTNLGLTDGSTYLHLKTIDIGTNAVDRYDTRQNLRAAKASPHQFRETLRRLHIIANPPDPITVSSITRGGTTVTVTLASAPAESKLIVGDTFSITGCDQADYNNGHKITEIVSETQFKFEILDGATPATPATGSPEFQRTAHFNYAPFGDSVSALTAAHVFDKLIAGIEPNSVFSETYSVEGNAWRADGTAGQPYDYEVAFNGIYFSIGADDGSGLGIAYNNNVGGNVFFDFASIVYVKEPGAGRFKLQISDAGSLPSTWTDIPGHDNIDASAADLTVGRIVIRQQYEKRQIRAVHVSGGRVRIVKVFYRALSRSGYNTDLIFSRGGLAQSQSVLWNSSIRDAVVNDVDPCLLFSEWKDAIATVTENLGNLVTGIRSGKSTQIDFAFMLSPPTTATGDPTESSMYLQNMETLKVAEAFGDYWFDSFKFCQSFEEMAALGWDGDGTHYDTQLGQILGGKIISELWFLWSMSGRAMPFPVKAKNVTVTERFSFNDLTERTVTDVFGNESVTKLSGSFVSYYDASGNFIKRDSFHPSRASNPSMTDEWLKLGSGPLALGRTMTQDSRGALILQGTLSGVAITSTGAADGILKSANVPYYSGSSGGTIVVGNGYITTTSGEKTFTLPSSPRVNDKVAITSRLGSWKIAQPANTIIRSGASATTEGVTGSLAGAQYDSIELLCVGADGGIYQWRVLSASPGATLTWT